MLRQELIPEQRGEKGEKNRGEEYAGGLKCYFALCFGRVTQRSSYRGKNECWSNPELFIKCYYSACLASQNFPTYQSPYLWIPYSPCCETRLGLGITVFKFWECNIFLSFIAFISFFLELFLLSNLLILLSANLYLPLFHFYPFSFSPLSLVFLLLSFFFTMYIRWNQTLDCWCFLDPWSFWSCQWLRPNGCGFVIGLCRKQLGAVGEFADRD